ncbi:MAG: dTDP-4-dehydrorhamnose 3,5-epimerase family protein [Patescibacteria group bacterium]|nr:dTDP-4-dehydrorhamnose 3,5-epimerase family protein [Patescibacteria group bacterium]MCL5224335.1 dTDP-4-dehydrorhamnose 3,5-epimerase family protein [Patescibacteria group bacterium]
MKILSTTSLSIPDVKTIKFERFIDGRGFFTEPYRKSDFDSDLDLKLFGATGFVQMNESFSNKNVCRGLHFQWNPFMGKLVRTLYGHMIDIILDIRKNSPTFGKVIAYDMPTSTSDTSNEWIWVPPGFAHGNYFVESSRIEYLCSGEYSPNCEAVISPLSKDLDLSLCTDEAKSLLQGAIPLAIMSDKDKGGLSLTEWVRDQRSDNFIYGRC